MNKIFGLLFGTLKRTAWTVGVFGLLGLSLRVAPQATEQVLNTILGLLAAGFSVVLAVIMPFLVPVIMIAILWWMVKKLFGKK